MDNKLTPEQIKNWRNYLYTIIGSYALICSEKEIQMFKDTYQGKIDRGVATSK